MNNRPVVIIACRVFQELIQTSLPPDLAGCQTHYLDFGLHRTPARLGEALQASLNALPDPSLVVLGYGLCGNGLLGLQAGRHRLLVPRADDCVAVLLGSRQEYLDRFQAEPGTYYLTRGWLEAGHDPLGEFEAYCERFDGETAAWLLDQQYLHYRRLALVTHSQADLEACRPRARQVAAFCQRWGMAFEEVAGSERLLNKLLWIAAGHEPVDDEFVVVEPGGSLSFDHFQPAR